MIDFKEISETILYHRKATGISQKELAELAGVGKTVVFDIEKGKETVRFSSLMKVLLVLNINISLESKLMEAYRNEKS